MVYVINFEIQEYSTVINPLLIKEVETLLVTPQVHKKKKTGKLITANFLLSFLKSLFTSRIECQDEPKPTYISLHYIC